MQTNIEKNQAPDDRDRAQIFSVVMPSTLVRALDAQAKKEKRSRSNLLVVAAAKYLEGQNA